MDGLNGDLYTAKYRYKIGVCIRRCNIVQCLVLKKWEDGWLYGYYINKDLFDDVNDK